MRHPAIANGRICGYDEEKVTFWHYKTMSVDNFISQMEFVCEAF